MDYEWCKISNGVVVTTTSATVPPDTSGDWKRVYSFGVASVPGAAGSPARTSIKKG